MAYGLQVVNANGFIQIDETYRNLHFKQKGTSNTTAVASGSAGNSTVTVSITAVDSIMLIALRCGVLVSITNYQIAGTTVNVTLVANGPVGTAIDWYVYDTAPAAQRGKTGLHLFNRQGQLVFDSSRVPMRVVDTYQVNGSTGDTKTYATGRRYAAVFSPGIYVVPVRTGPEGSNGYAVNLPGVRINESAGQVTVSPFQIQGATGTSFSQTLPSAVMVVDVTYL